MSIEAMKQMVEALEIAAEGGGVDFYAYAKEGRQAIAEAEKQEQDEPVGKFAKFTDGIWREVADGSAGVPLYTTPHPKQEPESGFFSREAMKAHSDFHSQQRTWLDLTDEEIQAEWLLTPQHDKAEGLWFGRRLEAKLKEKNNG